ncbi:MAG: 7-cyano-7-deazaguanine synthase QueC [Gammaproteobacteria bacterium]|nr:7-cyano-7-deazaguanine synthase QueC [Gammaproteobacteria bacterium]
MNSKAVVLVSGGLDSATTLAIARSQGHACYALSFDYSQRHIYELSAAKKIAAQLGVEQYKVIKLDLAGITGSALTDPCVAVPDKPSDGIPVTYVPARNTVFLSLALGWAEVLNAHHIFIGVNAVDYSGYPDCRPKFIKAFEKTANLATKLGVEKNAFKIETPLIHLSKADIIRKGIALGVDYSLTVSCYNPDAQGQACGVCDSCRIRVDGFSDVGIDDPAISTL